jgi:hypothetical protein
MKIKAICGKEFDVKNVDKELSKYPEYLCSRFCPEKNCTIYVNYNYWVSHNNDPK